MAKFRFVKKKQLNPDNPNQQQNQSQEQQKQQQKQQHQQELFSKKRKSRIRSSAASSGASATSSIGETANSPAHLHSKLFSSKRFGKSVNNNNNNSNNEVNSYQETMPSIHEPLTRQQQQQQALYGEKPYGEAAFGATIPYKSRPPPNLNVMNPWNRFKIFNSPFPRYRHAASSISSEKNEIFIMGGLKEGSVFGDTWKIIPQEGGQGEVLNYVAENIEILNSNNNPPARVGHSSVLCGNAFIIYGGDTVETDENGFPDNNFYLFNINNNKYTIPGHIQNKPNGRYGHTLGVISLNNQSSRLYLFGGQLENDVFNDLYYFELNSFKSPKASWKLVEPKYNFKPPPLTNHSMSIYNNKIYVFGGVYNNEKVSNDLWVFDAEEEKWTQVETSGTVPLPVNEHSSCIVDDRLYIYGGNDFSGIIYSSLYYLDLNTLVWFKLLESAEENGPGPRCGHSMTYLPKYNKLIVMGGDKNDYIVSDPHNFDTYETFNGEEIGTMIYELDAGIVDHFMSAPVEQVKKPRKIAASASATAAAATTTTGGKPEDGFDNRYGRHARSYSAGPEDYATPLASTSPERAENEMVNTSAVNEHDFVEVDVPSGTISQFDHEDLAHVYQTEATTPHDTPIVGGHMNGHFDTQQHEEEEQEQEQEQEAKKQDIEEQENIYAKRRSLDPKAGEPADTSVTNVGVSGAGVAAAFAAAGAASAKKHDVADAAEAAPVAPVAPVEEPSKSNFVDQSYGPETSHYPEETSRYPEEYSEDANYSQRSTITEPLQTRKSSVSKRETSLKAVTPSPTSSVQETDKKAKKIIVELTNELAQLKQSTKEQMQKATERIEGLEKQHSSTKALHQQDVDNYIKELHERDAMINELKSTLDPSAWDPEQPAPSSKISDLNRYKLERLELKNKLVYLEQENKSLKAKFEDFEPFMNNHIGQLDKLQKVIKLQEDQIEKLSHQVKDQESLNKEINEWKTKYDNLNLKFENYKAIYNDDEISANEEEEEEENELDDEGYSTPRNGGNGNGNGNGGDNRSILSSARSKREISSQLGNLVNLWSMKQQSAKANVEEKEAMLLATPENNPVVARLQQQVDELLAISKQNEESSSLEIELLRKELDSKLKTLHTLEENYKESLQSVNNTSKALKLNQDELYFQRQSLEKLMKENRELKMYKRASTKKVSSKDGTPSFNDYDEARGFSPENEEVEVEEEDEEVISNAHYHMKIKDLEADLYILKQERDQLKDNVTTLQKQLYLSNKQD
ncbi:KEL2 [Candida oxycetoniae]|uniref:KEL2 n=1 Tax=Candida oxycetoniae TaxID=497107 RepID=A0AAI9WXT9_9ASCO|nr:KEL2 [Candida oxycetoniae]KAI3404667.2 KEL2 [Candida oxycetoniae]